MKEFLAQSVLPLGTVCALVAGLTLALFDVAPEPPPEGPPAPQTAISVEVPVSAPLSRNIRRERMNEVLARAAVAFGTNDVPIEYAKTPEPAGAAGSPAGVRGDLVHAQGALAALASAVQAARNARTEQDLLHAEERLRAARLEMEASCRQAGGPLCESAQQMRALGF